MIIYLLTLSSWERIVHAVLGSHILLNLRKVNDNRFTGIDRQDLGSIASRRPRAGNAAVGTRSIVEQFGDEVEEWLTPDPQLYPSIAIPPRDEVESEVETVESGLVARPTEQYLN